MNFIEYILSGQNINDFKTKFTTPTLDNLEKLDISDRLEMIYAFLINESEITDRIKNRLAKFKNEIQLIKVANIPTHKLGIYSDVQEIKRLFRDLQIQTVL